jgi:hypothetical protein
MSVLLLLCASVTGAAVLHDVAFQHAESLLRLSEDLGVLLSAAKAGESASRDERLYLGYVVLLPWQIELERNHTTSSIAITDVSMSESLHALCWSLPHDLFTPLSLHCNALNSAFTTAYLHWIRADDGAAEIAARVAVNDARLALRNALLDFLNLYRWPHACRAGGAGVASLTWSEFDALMDGESQCMSLTSAATATNASTAAALDAPFIVILHRGDNDCAPSSVLAGMLRRSVARRFPTVHFFELYSRSSYWSLVSSLSIKVAMSPSDSDIVRVLRQFTATPALVLLQCRRANRPGAAMLARHVSTFGRSTTSFYITQWLAWRTGLSPQLESDVTKRARAPLESEYQQFDIAPSEEVVFVMAALFLFVTAAWRFKAQQSN